MRLKVLTAAAAVSSLIAVPAVANPASSLSLSNAAPVRAAARTARSSHASGVGIAAIIGAIGVVAGGIIIAVSAKDDTPDSN